MTMSADRPDRDPVRPSNSRIMIWVVVGAIALYFIGSGVWGLLSNGG